jgi:hypothetical protein
VPVADPAAAAVTNNFGAAVFPELTQTQIAEQIGLSQIGMSRVLRQTLSSFTRQHGRATLISRLTGGLHRVA